MESGFWLAIGIVIGIVLGRIEFNWLYEIYETVVQNIRRYMRNYRRRSTRKWFSEAYTKCPECGETVGWSAANNKQTHFREKHLEFVFSANKINYTLVYTCLICNKRFPNFKTLVGAHRHIDITMEEKNVIRELNRY